MQLYDDKKNKIGMITGFKDRTITKTLDSGDKELSFEYPADGRMADLLKEEYYIRTKEDEFVIKAVEAGEQYNKYTAVLNIEELEGQAFVYGFASHEQTIRACLDFAFEGTGWAVGECTVTKKRTIDIDEAATAWDVLQSCLSTYRCECEIDSLQKRINIYTQIGRDRGCYFMEGLNLRKLTASSDTYDFYTRIIPIGKDGIKIEWMGKEYLENYQYSSKIKTYTWKDERYTNTTSLIEDAEAKLEELSKPYKVYAADVVDLANANQEYKNILDYSIGDTVMMVSKHPKMREKQRIVKIVEYPETPEKNTIELSNTTKTFAEVQKTETELAKTEAIAIANSKNKKFLADNYYTKSETESHITASEEAIKIGVSQKYETKEVVSQKVSSAIQTANQATDEKLTEYSTTQEMYSAINLAADSIELGVSRKYETKEVVSQKVSSAIQTANQATDEKLTEYSTTQEMYSAINLAADSIELGVSRKYETKEVVSQKVSSAIQTANQATDEKLTEYSTTQEMNAAIIVAAEDISTKVSKKVGYDEFGTLVTQNAYNVRIAWNQSSAYMQFEETGITLYNGAINDNQKRTSFKHSGIEFYRDGFHVGNIGTNQWENPSKKGLVFNLDKGAYMAWGHKEEIDNKELYYVKWTYSAEQIEGMSADTINAGADIDMHNHMIKNVSWEGGGVTGRIDFIKITNVNSNGDIQNWTTNCRMVFKNGILVEMAH